MPVANYRMAAVVYNDSIYLIGGTKRLIIFDPSSQQFTFYDEDFLPVYMYGSSNWYKQRDNLLYMYSRDFDLRVFDLSTRQFTQDNFTLPDNGWQREPCVAGDDNYLYYLGSGVANGPWKDVHFLSFDDIDPVWQRGPDMIS